MLWQYFLCIRSTESRCFDLVQCSRSCLLYDTLIIFVRWWWVTQVEFWVDFFLQNLLLVVTFLRTGTLSRCSDFRGINRNKIAVNKVRWFINIGDLLKNISGRHGIICHCWQKCLRKLSRLLLVLSLHLFRHQLKTDMFFQLLAPFLWKNLLTQRTIVGVWSTVLRTKWNYAR